MNNFLFSNNSCRILASSVILFFSLNSVSVFAQATLSDSSADWPYTVNKNDLQERVNRLKEKLPK